MRQGGRETERQRGSEALMREGGREGGRKGGQAGGRGGREGGRILRVYVRLGCITLIRMISYNTCTSTYTSGLIVRLNPHNMHCLLLSRDSTQVQRIRNELALQQSLVVSVFVRM